ncbi:MAG: NACHT domain-containing protein [Waterburya sp.]
MFLFMTGSEIIPIAQELIGKIDPAILESATKGLATAIGKVAGEAGIKFLGDTGVKLLDSAGNLTQAAQDILFRISQKYIAKYTERHGTLKVLGMGKPVSLDSVYTKVNFQADIICGYQSLNAQEQVFRQKAKEDREKRPGLEVANQEQYLMVLGNPGTGKTTFLRKVGLEALKGKGNGEYQHTCIPVLLELRKFRSGEINLVQALASEFQNCGLPEYQNCTEELLKKGRLLILLDGLDEVPSDRLSEMTTQIRDLLDHYSDNRFIASCRIAAYRNFHSFQRFTDVAIADFDDEQIETFIGKWFESHSRPEWGQQCWEKLNSGEHNATKELTKTPLLLALLCILFKEKREFPDKRAIVYKEAFYQLLSKWDFLKKDHFSPYKEMNPKFREIMLSKIAYDNFVADNLFFQEVEITQQIEEILGKMLPDEKFIDGRAVLRAIEEQHGVLVSRADDIYSFSHLTLQEFLTAKHIVDNGIDINELVANHLCDHRWREVFLILAGLKRADELLLKMEQKINSLIATSRLQDLLLWVEQVTDSSAGDFQPVGKRAIALTNILVNANISIGSYIYVNALANVNANINDYPNANVWVTDYSNADVSFLSFGYAKTIDKAIDYVKWSEKFQIYQNINYSELIAILEKLKQEIPDDNESKEVRQAFRQRLIQIWLTAFHLTPEMIDKSKSELDLSKPELKGLKSVFYFYANLLMVECHRSAVRVSPETWEKIESRMLLPFQNLST